MPHVLPQDFYRRPTLSVASELIGKFLTVKQKTGSMISRMITEVEAYDGPRDKASHAAHGKTERNKIMFEAGGIWYIYFIYGMYDMLNIVTGPAGYPAAVLVRGVEGIHGPGRLTKMLGITRAFNGLSPTKKTGLYIEERGVYIPETLIETAPRIGVAHAGPVWAKKHYRFFIDQDTITE